MTVRGLLHTAACKHWSVGSIDVTGAFLQAPRRNTTTATIVQPPRILQQLNIVSAQERWKVSCALYGLVESPGDWAQCRDQGLEVMKWSEKGMKFWLERTPEQHLWKIRKAPEEAGEKQGTTAGWVAVYVDDFLITMNREELPSAFAAIKKRWKCSEEEYVTTDKAMRFCGYEVIAMKDGGFLLKQEGYVRDILDKYQVQGVEAQPVPRIEGEEDEENHEEESIKQAQTLCGELLWLAGRTRPDLSYGTGLMSRMIHRRPKMVIRVAHQMLRYLNNTPSLELRYWPVAEESEDWRTLRVLADTSFAPPHEKYISASCHSRTRTQLVGMGIFQTSVYHTKHGRSRASGV